MRLDMISRRRFLKSAGVAALAVAAAGVLAGCDGGDSSSKVPGTEVPDVSGTTSKKVNVIFTDVEAAQGKENVGEYKDMSVLKDAKTVDPKNIPADKLPQGYELADTTPVAIFEAPNGYDYAVVSVKKIVVTPTTKDVIVQLRSWNDGKKFNVTVTVAKDAKGVKPSQVPMPEGYEFYPGMYDANTEYPFSTEGTNPDNDFFFMIQKKA